MGQPYGLVITSSLGSCNYIFPWRMFHTPGIFNFCDIHAPSLYSFTHHQIMRCPREEKERLHPGELTMHSSCYLLYTSEPIWKPQATSCSFITLCFWGKSIHSFLSIHSPIKNIHFYLYSIQNSAFSSCGTPWLRMGQEGKELLHKVNRFTCVLRPHCCLLSFVQCGHKDYLESKGLNKS